MVMYTGPDQAKRNAKRDTLAKVIEQFQPDPQMLADAIYQSAGDLGSPDADRYCREVVYHLGGDESDGSTDGQH